MDLPNNLPFSANRMQSRPAMPSRVMLAAMGVIVLSYIWLIR